MATRNLVINDPVGIHARPAAMFAQAVTASGQTVTIAKEGGNAVPAGSILSIMFSHSWKSISKLSISFSSCSSRNRSKGCSNAV